MFPSPQVLDNVPYDLFFLCLPVDSNYLVLKKTDMDSVFNLFQEREENKTLVYVSISTFNLCRLLLVFQLWSLFAIPRCFSHSSWGSFFPTSIPSAWAPPPFRKWPTRPVNLWILDCVSLSSVVHFYHFSVWKYLLKCLRCFKCTCDHFCVNVRHEFQDLVPHIYCEWLIDLSVVFLTQCGWSVFACVFCGRHSKKESQLCFMFFLVHIHALI